MADRMRKPMLILLGIVCSAAATSIGTFIVQQRIASLQRQISHYNRLLASLDAETVAQGGVARSGNQGGPDAARELAAIQKDIAIEKARTYAAGSVDLSVFASAVQQELQSEGLSVLRYRPVQETPGVAPHTVEFVVHGAGEALLAFLRLDTTEGKYRYIKDVSIHATSGSNSVEATVRVAYEQASTDSTR